MGLSYIGSRVLLQFLQLFDDLAPAPNVRTLANGVRGVGDPKASRQVKLDA